MKRNLKVGLSVLIGSAALACGVNAVHAAPVGVDGTIGAEWAGVTPVHVDYNPLAPSGDFSTPFPGSNTVGYNTYVRDDGSYYYLAVQADSATTNEFANVYLGNPSQGAILGFEIENKDAFVPGGSVYSYASDPGNDGIVYADNFSGGSGTTIEFAVPNTFFKDNPLNIPTLPLTDEILQFRDSQSFGYTYAGGATYVPDRFGSADVSVPEPASLSFLGLGGAAVLLRRRRRTN